MKIITYEALNFVKKFADTISVKQNLDSTIWTDFYKIFSDPYIGLSDRSETIKFPIKTFVPNEFKIPSLKTSSFNTTYEECCLERASEILSKQDELDVPIHLMYSGGIDSTVALSSFIKLLGVKEASKRVVLLMSKESKDENPYFYYKFIRPSFKIKSSELGYNDLDFGNWIYVTGELNDQLFGSDIYYDISGWQNDQYLNKEINIDNISLYFQKGKNISKTNSEKWAKILIEAYSKNNLLNFNNQLWDLFWWYNFSWKWIYVYYRIFLFSKDKSELNQNWIKNNYFPFFSSTTFQLWSLNNKEPKHLHNINSYKHIARKFICSVYGSDELLSKTKVQSLKNIVIYRPRSKLLTSDLKIIDSDFTNIKDIYNKENSLYG